MPAPVLNPEMVRGLERSAVVSCAIFVLYIGLICDHILMFAFSMSVARSGDDKPKHGRTLAFIGSSGVGKSTLLNTLAGEEWAATQEIQEWSGKGRHTTTSRELVILPSGAMIIDTPGIREIGMIGEEDDMRVKGEASHRWRK